MSIIITGKPVQQQQQVQHKDIVNEWDAERLGIYQIEGWNRLSWPDKHLVYRRVQDGLPVVSIVKRMINQSLPMHHQSYK